MPMDSASLKDTYPDYREQIAHVEERPAQSADSVPATAVLPVRLARHLPHDNLYTHQAEALDVLADGEDVCVTTATASGKTLIYALHIARTALQDGKSALLIYPTKALARDQQSELVELYDQLNLDLDVGVYDGDVNSDEKRRVRNECDIIISNFQGLNYYLSHHNKWEQFFDRLGTLVIDEAHTYNGVEGMHVAWIIRRLLRIVNKYDATPQVTLTSATIGNPTQHAKRLTGRDVTVVDNDGSPRGRRDIVLWNPPAYQGENGEIRRRSNHRESSDILAHLVDSEEQTLMFAPSRKMTELCAQWTSERLETEYGNQVADVEPYNAGHTDDERRAVESALKRGESDAVVSTPALEVGIDVGTVDATVLDGYPGRRTSFWQQLGRAGRGTRDALAVLVTRNDSIDQYIVNNPEYLFDDSIEDAVINLSNRRVFRLHLLAAANELPLTDRDERWFGPMFHEQVKSMKLVGELSGSLATGVTYDGDERPEANVNLYGTGSNEYDLTLSTTDGETKSLPSVDGARACREFHPGAVYLHKGEYYIVTDFDEEQQSVHLEPSDVNYYTEADREVDITNLESEEDRTIAEGIRAHRGTAVIRETYPTFRKIGFDGDTVAEGVETGIDSEVELRTQVCWLEFDKDCHADIRGAGTGGPVVSSLHAAEHGLIKMAPTTLTVDSGDLGGLSTEAHPETQGATLFVYDGISGGVGFSHSVFDNLEDLAEKTAGRLNDCACQSPNGCPACTMSANCGDENEALDRLGGAHALKLICE